MAETLRVEESRDEVAEALQRAPWIATSVLAAADEIKKEAGILGAIAFAKVASATLTLWDSEDSTTTDDNKLAPVLDCSLDERLYVFPVPGVEFKKGLYVAIAGSPSYVIYYK